MNKQNILDKRRRIKNKSFFIMKQILDEEPEYECESESEQSEQSEDEEKQQENDYYNLIDMLENIKKKNIKKFVKENRDEINALPSNFKNKLLDLIKDRLY